ncbi:MULTISPECIES: flagellar hook-length control protein FliK [Idiomarina]|jgi:flagellar hook-length control protein FliK|uniref:flagellar hook-length control protein FliK n=1 Tax=Idiomarina TaxID=135575 RepID=UPI000C4BF514|nr:MULTISPECIES: flagellar hook-length control protein FliK [Idiomarina]MAO68446.1 flagellar hook-length control protein [Idiomarina sp.]MBF80710.1 flagellar hook-length control protein [Idiomarina sp.]MBP58873.1 flagellar hook-length control protein [Idiomarina sp.]|tara:strand:- start:12378 stop:14156 length:1779 start_codon:yes stop_codon:yes gene_type:complete
MQQLLNLTESADNFARMGKGKGLSVKNAEGESSEFSRLMIKQNSGDKELQQLAAKLEAHQAANGDSKGREIDRKNVGEPVTRNLWELLQQMQQETADIKVEGKAAVIGEIDVEPDSGELELSDEELSKMLQSLLAKLDKASADGESSETVMTDAERQKFADQLLAGMTDKDKQALQSKLQQMIQAVEQGENAGEAVEDAGKFIVNLMEPMLPKADADKLLVGNEKALTQALNQAAEQAIAQQSVDKGATKPQSSEELLALLKQLEQQVSAQKSKGENSELSLAEQKKLQQFTAELRQLLAGQNNDTDKFQVLSKEQAAKAEQLLAEIRQLLKGRTGHSEKAAEPIKVAEQTKSTEPVITATNAKSGKEKAEAGDTAIKGSDSKQSASKAEGLANAVDVDTKLPDSAQQNQVFRNNTDALADANAARAIQGQMVSTTQGTVAANESGQTNTLQALQRPLDLQQTEASQKLQERINIMMSRNIQRADIRLDPPELGSVQIRVNMSGEQASVQFQVQSAQAKDAIETAMPRLREMLEQQGIDLADTQVGEQSKEGERTAGGQGGSAEESEDWAVEGEIALDEGRVLADGQVDFYV